jgi:hypothetical protein
MSATQPTPTRFAQECPACKTRIPTSLYFGHRIACGKECHCGAFIAQSEYANHKQSCAPAAAVAAAVAAATAVITHAAVAAQPAEPTATDTPKE